MIECYAVEKSSRSSWIESYETLEQGIQDIRQLWHEEGGHQLFFFRDETGQFLATMATGFCPEICITTYLVGTQAGDNETHYIVYVLDNEGRHYATSISLIPNDNNKEKTTQKGD